MSNLRSVFWSTKFTLASLALLALGWWMLNIWIVIAGTLLGLITMRRLQMDDSVNISIRLSLVAALMAVLIALYSYAGNKDFLLAAVVYGLVAGFTPWKVRSVAP